MPQVGDVAALLWSDPQDPPGHVASTRGAGATWGPDVTDRWHKDNGLHLTVRAHQTVLGGLTWHHGGRVVTVFSASFYAGAANKGAVLRLVPGLRGQQDLEPHVHRYWSD